MMLSISSSGKPEPDTDMVADCDEKHDEVQTGVLPAISGRTSWQRFTTQDFKQDLPFTFTSSRTMSKQRALPLELTDNIIDYAHADKSTLFACSLVCKDWLPSTRFHLFTIISILLKTPRDDRRAPQFIALVNSPYSTITTRLKGLSITSTSLNAARIPVIVTAIVDSKKTDIEALKYLRLDFCYDTWLSERWSFFPQLFPNITNVFLRNLPLRGVDDIFHFLCTLPRLEVLEVESAETDDIPIDHDPGMHMSDSLRSLSFINVTLGWSLNLINYVPPIPQLSTLRLYIDILDSEYEERISMLLRANQQTLRYLHLYGADKGGKRTICLDKHQVSGLLTLPSRIISGLDLSSLSELRSLTLGEVYHSLNPDVSKLLQSIHSDYMEELVITECDISSSGWPELSALLQEPRFLGLQRLELDFFGAWGRIEFPIARSFVEQHFPTFTARGIVDVHV